MLALILLGFLVYVLPRFQEVFKDLDVELPRLTLYVLNADRFVQMHFHIVGSGWILFLLVDIMVCVQVLRGGQRSLAFLWSTLILLAGAGAILIIFAATRACELTGHKNPAILNTLAGAYASQGELTKAVEVLKKAIDLALPPPRPSYTICPCFLVQGL